MKVVGFKLGFIGELKIEIVGGDVLDAPQITIIRQRILSGKHRSVEDVGPYIWLTPSH